MYLVCYSGWPEPLTFNTLSGALRGYRETLDTLVGTRDPQITLNLTVPGPEGGYALLTYAGGVLRGSRKNPHSRRLQQWLRAYTGQTPRWIAFGVFEVVLG